MLAEELYDYTSETSTVHQGAFMIEQANIVLLIGDDHVWDDVGYNGHPFVITPVPGEMAAGGLRFDRFYSGHANCSPTRGEFYDGPALLIQSSRKEPLRKWQESVLNSLTGADNGY